MMKVALWILMALTGAVWADGGSVLFQQRQGNYDVTVFGLPSPLRAGPVDISVLIQDVTTKEPVLDASVGLSLQPLFDQTGQVEVWTPPYCSMKRADDSYEATREQSQNKLMYHAFFPIPTAGDWNLTLELRHRNAAHYFVQQLTVAPPQKPVLAYWPLLALPVLVIGGFVLNRAIR